VFFGAEGQRGPTISMPPSTVGRCAFGQSTRGLRHHAGLHRRLWLFFGPSPSTARRLRATAVNRLGARLVGIRTTAVGTESRSCGLGDRAIRGS